MKSTKIFIAIFFLLIARHNFIYSQTDDVVSIKSEIAKSVDAFNKKNLDRTMSIYSEDYACYYAGHPDQQKKTLRDDFEKIFLNQYLTAKLTAQIIEVRTSGNFGFVVANYVWSFKPTMATAAQTAREKNLQIWEKQADGNWVMIRCSTFPVELKRPAK